MIAALKFTATAVNGLNDDDVKISKRLNLSSRKLRGFEPGKIGPKDGKDFIGGNYAYSVNLEANLPNFFPEEREEFTKIKTRIRTLFNILMMVALF